MLLHTKSHVNSPRRKARPWSALLFLFMVLLLGKGSEVKATGSLSPERLRVCPGDEVTFTCSVEESGGTFTWIKNTTSEACRVFSSSPQSQCGQFIAQLQTSNVSTLTATSAVTSDPGNILIQCNHNVDLVGNATLLIADPGTPPPTPILRNVTSEDIQDNGDGDIHNITLRWTLSEPDECLNTIHFSVTPNDPTHCGSCEVGPGDPGMPEEFSCQVMQGIGQSCTYTVYAVRCGDTQNGTMSEPVEVNTTGSPTPTVSNTPLGSPTPTVSNTPVSNTPVYNTPVSNTPQVSPTPTVSNTPQEVQDTECGFCWYHILLIAVSVLLMVTVTVVSVAGYIGLSRRRTKIGANRELRYSMTLSPSVSITSESAVPGIGVELSSCKGPYEDPDELLSRDNSQTGKSGTSQPKEPAIEEHKPLDINIEYKPEDHLPTYADPKDIKRETTEKTGEVYTLFDVSKKKKKRHSPAVKKGAYADPKDIKRETTEKTGEVYALVDVSKKKKKKRQSPAVKKGAYADPKDIKRETMEKTGEVYMLVDVSKKKKKRQSPAMKQEEEGVEMSVYGLAALNLDTENKTQATPHLETEVQYSVAGITEHPPPQEKGDMWKTASTLV